MGKSATEAHDRVRASWLRPQTALTLKDSIGAGGLVAHLGARRLEDHICWASLVDLGTREQQRVACQHHHWQQTHLICSLSSHGRVPCRVHHHENASGVRLPATPRSTLRSRSLPPKLRRDELFYADVNKGPKVFANVKKPLTMCPHHHIS